MNQFVTLLRVISELGWKDHYVIKCDGTMYCIADLTRKKEHFIYLMFSLKEYSATLYLIKSVDGSFAGTAVEYWDTFDE